MSLVEGFLGVFRQNLIVWTLPATPTVIAVVTVVTPIIAAPFENATIAVAVTVRTVIVVIAVSMPRPIVAAADQAHYNDQHRNRQEVFHLHKQHSFPKVRRLAG